MKPSPTDIFITFSSFLPPLTSIDFLPPSFFLLSSPPLHYLYNLQTSSILLLPSPSSTSSFSSNPLLPFPKPPPPSSFFLPDSSSFYPSVFLPSSSSFLSPLPSSSFLPPPLSLPPPGWNGRWRRIDGGIIIFENFLKDRMIKNVISYWEEEREKISFLVENVVNWSDSHFIYKGENNLFKKRKTKQEENKHQHHGKYEDHNNNNDLQEEIGELGEGRPNKNLNLRTEDGNNNLKSELQEEKIVTLKDEMLIFVKIFENQVSFLKLFLNNGTHEISSFSKKIFPYFFPVYSELWEYKGRRILEIWGNSKHKVKLFLLEVEEEEEGGMKELGAEEEAEKRCENLNMLFLTDVFHERASPNEEKIEVLLKKSKSYIEGEKLKTILILRNGDNLKAIFYELYIHDLNNIAGNVSRSIVFEEIIDLRKEYLICFSNLNNFFVVHKSKKSSLQKREEENLTQIKLQIFSDVPERKVFQTFLLEKTGLLEKFGESICNEIIKF